MTKTALAGYGFCQYATPWWQCPRIATHEVGTAGWELRLLSCASHVSAVARQAEINGEFIVRAI